MWQDMARAGEVFSGIEFDMKRDSKLALCRRWSAVDGNVSPSGWFSADQLLAGVSSPFGQVTGREDFRGLPLQENMRLGEYVLKDIDFSGADIRGAHFKGTKFVNCIFDGTCLASARQWRVQFENCRFVRTDFSNATFGADGALYAGCIFDRAIFTRTSFIRPEFVDCAFLTCRLKGADFNMSQFVRCRFTGKLSDVRFNGYVNDPRRRSLFGEAAPNRMTDVDFSEAVFDYVSFDNECDLSTVRPPTDGFHVFLPNLNQVLDCVEKHLAAEGNTDLRAGAAIWIPLLRGFAHRQTAYIVSGHDFSHEGTAFAKGFLDLLRGCAGATT
jgi:uncharacterized protein YjbI with pentapeptide repeats